MHDNDVKVCFSVNGDVRLTGDNPASSEDGVVIVLLQSGIHAGTVIVSVYADGFQKISLPIRVIE